MKISRQQVSDLNNFLNITAEDCSYCKNKYTKDGKPKCKKNRLDCYEIDKEGILKLFNIIAVQK